MVKFCRAVPTASPDSLLNPIPISSSPKMILRTAVRSARLSYLCADWLRPAQGVVGLRQGLVVRRITRRLPGAT